MDALVIDEAIQIPIADFEVSYARSGGPGGQNVNKVNSKVVLRWAVRGTNRLPFAVKSRFLFKYANKITTDGDLIIMSQKFRDQTRNFEDCLEKLRFMLEFVVPAPIIRREVKPSRNQNAKRVQLKRVTAQKKSHRQAPSLED